MRFKIGHIIVLAMVLRLFLNFPVIENQFLAEHNDSYLHLKIAENLKDGNGFSSCGSAPFYKNTIITPGYPYFLVGIQSIAGTDLRIIVVIQIVLDLLICWFIYFLGLKLFDRKSSLVASLLYAVSSHAITYSGLVITETIFTLLLLIAVFAGITIKKNYVFLVLGILYALLVLIRPIALYLLPIFGLFSIQKFSIEPIMKGLATMIIGALLVFPWMARNQALTGAFTVSSITEYNLYFTFANALEAKMNNRHEDEQRLLFKNGMEYEPLAECSGQYGYVRESRTKGINILKSNPFLYARIHLTSIINMFLPEVTLLSEKWGLSSGGKGTLGVINKDGIWEGFKHYYQQSGKGFLIMIPFVLIWLFSLMSFFVGIFMLIKKQLWKGWGLILLIIVYFIIIPGPAGNGRFLMPVIPLICLIAGLGISNILLKMKRA